LRQNNETIRNNNSISTSFYPSNDNGVGVVSKIRKSARGQDCQLRFPSICNHNPETVVLCHINTPFKGWSLKSPDLFGVYGCYECHKVLDGQNTSHEFTPEEVKIWAFEGMIRTQKILMDEGLIKI